ncbi:sulfatase-like hydrolase/transferase [Novipirellula artificiosorum]|uniref:Arylsulfatase n=1 Tax=Novipirellula artificiosorum TaxID=2528016 RepID=A0A5C6DAP5_9BACT|nr:sulfatase-like hydrolase/transferase [Novipirellula artificiosorum]TWU33205.1 Arylsulfatase precursor [Novipirellula artificiosorum]
MCLPRFIEATLTEFYVRTIFLPCFAILLSATSSLAAERPNVIVVFTDDHGYADLGCQEVFNDLKTPHLDALASGGIRMTDGYCTAPQCVPSRGGLISGQYQTKWGLESNPQFKDAAIMERFDQLQTVPERLKKAGYVTAMAGKWHLGEDNAEAIAKNGFDKVFFKHSNAPGHWNMNLQGEDIPPQVQKGGGYHLDLISSFAVAFINRFKDVPFFLYLAYRAPHVPLDAPQHYLDRFPGEMPERRRQALAMLSAVDDGVGRVVSTLNSPALRGSGLGCCGLLHRFHPRLPIDRLDFVPIEPLVQCFTKGALPREN